MRFDVSNAMTDVGRKRLRSTDLIGDKPFDFRGREGNAATAESPQVGKAGMCTHPYTPRLGNTESMSHDLWIAPMKAAGNIGRGHNREHRVVITATIGAETFTKIGIEIDGNHELALVMLDASAPLFAYVFLFSIRTSNRQKAKYGSAFYHRCRQRSSSCNSSAANVGRNL
jgi:hypothetical protein